MKFFNTDLYAAPVFGALGAILVFCLGLFYLQRRAHSAKKVGEGYGAFEDKPRQERLSGSLPNVGLASLPLVTVLGLTLILQKVVFPHWEISSWAVLAPYHMDPDGLRGSMNNWALMIALSVAILFALSLNPGRIKSDFRGAINAGALGSLLAVMNTASEVGFGNVIKSLPGFQSIANSMMGIQEHGGVLLSEAVTVNVLAGVTGSASGGMSIALTAFSKDYLNWARQAGINPQLLHRVASMASGGMDTLPHNGAVITLLAITGMTHRDSYKDIFVITLLKTAVVFFLIGLQAIFHFV
jgi:H+/gluconate symporter-like permease